MQPLFMASDLKSFKKYSRGFLLLSYLTLWFICPNKKKMMDAALRSSFKRLFDYTITWFLVLDYTNALMNKYCISVFSPYEHTWLYALPFVIAHYWPVFLLLLVWCASCKFINLSSITSILKQCEVNYMKKHSPWSVTIMGSLVYLSHIPFWLNCE